MRYYNKRKSIVFVFTFLFILCISFVLSACVPEPHRIYSVGDEWTNDDISIKLDSIDYEKNDGMLEMQLEFIVNPTSEYILEYQDVYVYVVVEEPIYTDVEESASLNGYDIFGATITSESVYIFFFRVPLSYFYDEDGSLAEYSWNIGTYFKPAIFRLDINL